MSLGSAIDLLMTLAACGIVLVFWLVSRQEKRVREEASEDGADFVERLRNPQLDAMVAELGHSLPASYLALHADRELVEGDDWVFGVPNPVLGEEDFYVAWFEPADLETLSDVPPGCEGMIPVATNGLGDFYVIDPRREDPEVIYYTHEDDSCQGTGVTLGTLLASPRQPVQPE